MCDDLLRCHQHLLSLSQKSLSLPRRFADKRRSRERPRVMVQDHDYSELVKS